MKSQESLMFLFGIIIGLGLAVLFVYILYIKPEWNRQIKETWDEWPLRFNESDTESQSSANNASKGNENAGSGVNSPKPVENPGSAGQQGNQNLNGNGANEQRK